MAVRHGIRSLPPSGRARFPRLRRATCTHAAAMWQLLRAAADTFMPRSRAKWCATAHFRGTTPSTAPCAGTKRELKGIDPGRCLFSLRVCMKSKKKCLHCSARVLTYSPLFARSRDVAQFGRALRSGRRGRRFKSCRPDHLIAPAFLFSGHIGRAPKLGGLHENLWSWSS